MTIALAIICVLEAGVIALCWYLWGEAEENYQKTVAKADMLDVRCTVLEKQLRKASDALDEQDTVIRDLRRVMRKQGEMN